MQYNSTLYKCLVINLASLSPGTDTAAGQTRGRSRSCAPRARRLARAAWLGCRPSNKERKNNLKFIKDMYSTTVHKCNTRTKFLNQTRH